MLLRTKSPRERLVVDVYGLKSAPKGLEVTSADCGFCADLVLAEGFPYSRCTSVDTVLPALFRPQYALRMYVCFRD